MPVYNRGNHFLHDSIASVLNQSLSDFEFLILDDGSTDDSLAIIKQYAKKDQRIRILQNKQNRGIPFSTNRLLDSIKTEFAALLDSDDTCYPHRLERQYEFFQKNSDIDIVGTQSQTSKLPLSDWIIKSYLICLGPVLINASSMMRMKKINEHNIRYNPDFPFSQDYQLWAECMPFVKFANIDEILLHSNEHAGQAGNQNLQKQRADHMRTIRYTLQKYNIQISDRVLITLLHWQDRPLKKQDIRCVATHVIGLLDIEYFCGYQGLHAETLRLILISLYSNYTRKSAFQILMLGREMSHMTRKHKSIHTKYWPIFVLAVYARKIIRLTPHRQKITRYIHDKHWLKYILTICIKKIIRAIPHGQGIIRRIQRLIQLEFPRQS